ncbi:metal-dependent hydrolase [Fictibacillus macauensis ZFHKF-1]|uniref:Kynurenine formamidase n=1 Tax=Fictibacillus macauensis ZFHKF-1 TaxID=1196324 RepID=I8UFM8_9BACL|nr:arylformamidase [Fictibacillus macauensis]EIT85618.1 metal-dependent hydrolase [Fictibacillus macauensis ZFHKF-1]
MNRWLDISMPLHAEIPTWPGDTPYSFKLSWHKEQSGSVNVGQFTMSTHTGTHIDAPYHFDEHGDKVLALEVNQYAGRALVIDASHTDLVRSYLLENIEKYDVTCVLFKTLSWSDRSHFPERITAIDATIVPLLAANGIALLGVDVPSVDPLDSKTLPAHHALHKHQIAIVEGLVLDDIVPGVYEFMALPLPLQGADGSPVRAVLRAI